MKECEKAVEHLWVTN